MDDLIPIARKYALQNAVLHNGKADAGAAIGKMMSDHALRARSKEVIAAANNAVAEVNALTPEQQRAELEKSAPELLEKGKKKRDFSLIELPNAEQGKVVTRFPPEPNGYLHIGHAKAAIIDHEYARMYDGKLILRFDDTNPEKEDALFYEAQKKDLEWLGIKWDVEICTSQHIPKLYELAEQMIRQGDCYICECSQEDIGKGRYAGVPCKCREKTPEQNMMEWNELLHGKSESILRLKGDMKSQNTAMRDPTMFRVIEKPHPLLGAKYRLWPTYDFAGSIMDSISGVTHAFRTKEYELRDEVYFFVLDRLKLRKPALMEFARLAIEGMPVSKRLIKPLIDEKKVSGYDDPRLPTLRGLRRRGILPEAIKQFVLSQGKSKSESTITFDQVEAFNRKILDPVSRRAFFVPNPVMVAVGGAATCEVVLKYHPDANLGERAMHAGSTFYIPKSDADLLASGETFRLKDLYNVTVVSNGTGGIIAKFAGKELLPNTKKIQWVSDGFVEMEVLVPKQLYSGDHYNPDSIEIAHGCAEPSAASLKDGEIVQFERFGFVRIEHRDGKLAAVFTHK